MSSTPLNHYMQDGANHQARAVLCYLQGFNIEDSWSDEWKAYKAEPNVARWHNCREQGYIISLRGPDHLKCLNIAFFEHRNSDSICAIKWEQSDFPNPATIETADFKGACYKDKWSVSFEVGPGKVSEMSDWIADELAKWWLAQPQPKPKAVKSALTKGSLP